MRIWDFSRSALSSCVAAALLAGCGGSQPPIGAPRAMPQSSAAENARAASSSGDTLIYAFENITGGHGFIFAYPSGKLVDYAETPGLSPLSACSDANGDVFVGGSSYSEAGYIAEYTFGATSPSATVTLGAGEGVRSCSVDSVTGSVAAIVRHSAGSYYIAVLPGFQAPGQSYNYSGMATFVSIAYDGSGNLFLLGTSISGKQYYLAELANGAGSFEPVSFDLGRHIAQVRTLQWDGTYLTVEATYDNGLKRSKNWPQRVYRLSISGSSATLVGTVHFDKLRGFDYGTSWIQPDRGIMLFARNYYGIWNYPAGGRRLEKLPTGARRDGLQPYIATVAAPASGSQIHGH